MRSKHTRKLTPRQEAFAQGLAKGISQVKAYANAGYSGRASGSPSTLANEPRIVDRVSELIAEREKTVAAARAEAAKALALDREAVLRFLIDDRQRARELQQMASAIRAAELIGREIGMFIDRKDVTVRQSPLEGLTDERLEALLAKLDSDGEEASPSAEAADPSRLN